jgi:hypothetical protein
VEKPAPAATLVVHDAAIIGATDAAATDAAATDAAAGGAIEVQVCCRCAYLLPL